MFDTPFAPSTLGNPATAGQSNSIVMASGAPASSVIPLTVVGYIDSILITNPASLAAFVAVTPNSAYTIMAAPGARLRPQRCCRAHFLFPATSQGGGGGRALP
jgi:hypothetical protein